MQGRGVIKARCSVFSVGAALDPVETVVALLPRPLSVLKSTEGKQGEGLGEVTVFVHAGDLSLS